MQKAVEHQTLDRSIMGGKKEKMREFFSAVLALCLIATAIAVRDCGGAGIVSIAIAVIAVAFWVLAVFRRR